MVIEVRLLPAVVLAALAPGAKARLATSRSTPPPTMNLNGPNAHHPRIAPNNTLESALQSTQDRSTRSCTSSLDFAAASIGQCARG
jgi:hypothetical protein